MEIFFGFIVSFFLLIFSALKGIYIGYALIACWLVFVLISIKKGYAIKEILEMSYKGGIQSYVVVRILLLIGAVIGIWLASGTIAAIVYYCLKFISPRLFIFSAFVISCGVSFLLGTSLGSVSIVGIPLMIIAISGNVNLNMAAGAIIAGVYFGDRCSPMSGSAALVANLTKTNIFTNIKNMIYSSIIPLALLLVFYFILSIAQPLKNMNNNLSYELLGTFKIGVIILLPAIIIFILSLFKVKIYYSASISIFIASSIAVFFQHYQLKEVIQFIVVGVQTSPNSSLNNILKGGGIISMLKPSFVMFVSCSLSGIFKEIKVFDNFKNIIKDKPLTRPKLFSITSIVYFIYTKYCNRVVDADLKKQLVS